MVYEPSSTRDRFWSHVEMRGLDECWLWVGAVQRGYGAFRLTFPGGERRQVNANRVAFVLAYGPIETKDHVLHTCDTPLCQNPAHLFVGSRSDNMRDASSKGRMGGPKIRRKPLTGGERVAIAEAVSIGRPVRAVAREFGVAPVTVRRYRGSQHVTG